MGLVTLNFDLLTVKLVSELYQWWGTFFGIWALSSARVIRYVRDGRTDGRTKAMLIFPFPTGGA